MSAEVCPVLLFWLLGASFKVLFFEACSVGPSGSPRTSQRLRRSKPLPEQHQRITGRLRCFHLGGWAKARTVRTAAPQHKPRPCARAGGRGVGGGQRTSGRPGRAAKRISVTQAPPSGRSIFQILCGRRAACTERARLLPPCPVTVWRESTCTAVCVASSKNHFSCRLFLCEKTADLLRCSDWCLQRLSQMSTEWASHFPEQPTVFTASDPSQALKRKSEFWKTCTYYC